ncbi:MAG: potassium channel family protein [Acidimicrobiales bacterium]
MAPMDLVRIPRRSRAPFSAILRRISFAAALVVFVALVVRIGRDGYVDITNDPIGFLDALYYASVTVTTTGYGDITAVSDGGRLATILLITPARVLFLILVVSTTVEVLTDQSRELLLKRRWRQRVNDHFVICGFGATGQSAADDLVVRGVECGDIVVVDRNDAMVDAATARGFTGVVGDATRNDVLRQAHIDRAKAVIVAPSRDDTAVLIILTVRELNEAAHIVAGGREQENLHLLRQGGADEVIDATAAVGRMLGLGTYAPATIPVIDDILDAGEGLELVETEPLETGGRATAPPGATLVAIVRNGERLPPSDVLHENIESGDRLVVLQESR